MKLDGRTALVTGASRGIGRAVALALAAAGADLIVNYASNIRAAEQVAAEAQRFGSRVLLFQADVSRPQEAADLVQAGLDKFGRLDILVNNAGITRDNLLLRMTDQDWDEVINVNLKGVFNTTRAALRPMIRARHGRIIIISSVIGLRGNAGQANYAAAKAGLIGFTKSVAREVGSRSITANAVAPGFIQTEMTDKLGPAVRERMLSEIPLGRLGTPEDVAALVTFLASDAAGYITGQVIAVDGGMAM
ncbi:3-oxoacyl-[acyl-carrier-protein] reductase [Candidatus Desulforudis audaxviator]|uniref:3-oxoacyl-[acyl-carrier-protein] reductase n=1 Tax=Desulforudis audaxviator (strain MP104C) TaxID=477974 RepID=B1I2D1_DESAP|nr:3-oxoacyl-[acyl-carrier-protein] reductase [Candidatus Desulforudis audaxviator]ACA59176.1 3-oxoacyl-(acyl-carrier-protein) reductase [Candidatus Desulforudis audaxviator MP104C]AZK59245.1 3-oxoacyl-[acyl-carrier protein] reductase [Candidatus Desulforudis audaxviator]